MSALLTLPSIIAILVAMACLYAVYLLFRSLNSRDRRVPTVVSSQAARKHLALIYLIRGGEAMLVVPIFAVIILIGFSFMLASGFLLFIVLFSFLLVGAWRIATGIDSFSSWGREIFRKFQEMNEKFQRVNTNNISNFSFIFAAIASHDFHHCMRPATSTSRNGFGDRDLMWVIVFFALWAGMKFILRRLLEVDSSSFPQNPSDDPTIPEFPQKSPLIPL